MMHNQKELEEIIGSKLQTCEDGVYICIAGASCSGKTTLAWHLASMFPDAKPSVICQDRWFKDLQDFPKNGSGYYNMECPNAFHVDEFVSDVRLFLQNGQAKIPVYNIQSNTRINKQKEILKGKLTIIEGLHTVHIFHEILNIGDTLFVFLDGPLELCAKRCANRNYLQTDHSYEFLFNHYRKVVYPNYKPYIEEQINLLGTSDFLLGGE